MCISFLFYFEIVKTSCAWLYFISMACSTNLVSHTLLIILRERQKKNFAKFEVFQL